MNSLCKEWFLICRRKTGLIACAVYLAVISFPSVLQAAANLSLVPGEVLFYVPSPSAWDALIGNEEYTSDPEIIVLTNGWYLATHKTFGGDAPLNEVYLYKSTDKGTNWSPLITLHGATAGSSFFLHNDELYLMGGDYIIKSTNNGTSWTTPDTNVFSTSSTWTPNNPVLLSNRIWSAANTRPQSAPANSNLMLGASWKWGASPATNASWFPGRWQGWEEAQVVASPELGVMVLPKIRALPYTALVRADSSGNSSFDSVNNFVALPGGEKKFGATYDPVSGKFYILSNPVLPAHANDPNWGDTPELIRNTAAVFTSRDLFNWKAEKIFLYSPNIDYEAFQYFNFDFDGETLVMASRTAFDVNDTYKPPRGHDSNLITFHKIESFRSMAPDQYLKISGNQILRYERTQHQPAPLGSFTLGSTFAGAALNAPSAIGKTLSGDVYVQEAAGRILHFDALGNFIETNSSAPISLTATQINATQPSAGECSWVRSGSGDWFEPLSWYYWGRPDTTEEIAVFGSAATAATTVNIPSATQMWNFNTAGDIEGWSVGNASNTVASGGFLQGTANTTSNGVMISRSDRFFYGSAVPEVRIRFKSDVNCPVYFYWGTTVADIFAGGRKITQTYTNSGAFQELVFSMAGNANWDGKAITRIRFDPQVHTNAAARSLIIDSITVPKESYRMKGLRFRNSYPYTLAGGGQLRIEANSGSGSIEVLQGKHTNNVELVLGSDTDMVLTNNTSLHLKLGIDLNGKTLHVSGSGKLLMQDSLVMNGGTLILSGETPLTFTNNLTGAVLDGTLQFLPEGTFSPTNGASFDLLDNPSVLGTKKFAAVSLPVLSSGLKWNTNTLYSAGNVSVEAVQHSLIVTTSRGNAVPAAGTNTYNYGTNLALALTNSPILNGTTTQYVCRGWSGTGSVPASGTTTNAGSFTLTTNSTVSWLWTTNYWLNATVTTGGSVNVSNGWKTNGAVVQIAATTNTYYHFTGWSGDVTTSTAQITLTMSGARSVTASFAPNVTTNTATPEWWLAQYGLTNFNAAAVEDADHDGLLTWQEYIAGTNPTNPDSSFRITGNSVNAQGAVIRWSSASNRFYSLSRTTNLLQSFTAVAGATNLPATPPENVFTNSQNDGVAAFYKINVHE